LSALCRCSWAAAAVRSRLACSVGGAARQHLSLQKDVVSASPGPCPFSPASAMSCMLSVSFSRLMPSLSPARQCARRGWQVFRISLLSRVHGSLPEEFLSDSASSASLLLLARASLLLARAVREHASSHSKSRGAVLALQHHGGQRPAARQRLCAASAFASPGMDCRNSGAACRCARDPAPSCSRSSEVDSCCKCVCARGGGPFACARDGAHVATGAGSCFGVGEDPQKLGTLARGVRAHAARDDHRGSADSGAWC